MVGNLFIRIFHVSVKCGSGPRLEEGSPKVGASGLIDSSTFDLGALGLRQFISSCGLWFLSLQSEGMGPGVPKVLS